MDKVISMYESKKSSSKNIVLTDELIELLADEYLEKKEQLPQPMNFIQWVEYKTIKLL